MKPFLASAAILALAASVTACGIARYRNVEVRVVDPISHEPIPNARVRVVYTKPMMDMTYQRRDRGVTASDGRATLRIATNGSQFFILGRTHGISPALVVSALGHPTQDVRVPTAALTGAEPFVIELKSHAK